ncbi:MAG: methyltransferase type 12, partial [Sandarakinorhabdus sp.]|nr:methyltransferase type 12 [Sandarakinorhabdus sp.]
EQARVRNARHPHVRFANQQFPAAVPDGSFDLIVFSEVLYYLDRATLVDAALTTLVLAMPDAHILLVHWLGPTPDYPLNGDQAADDFITALAPDAKRVLQQRQPQYRIDLLYI